MKRLEKRTPSRPVFRAMAFAHMKGSSAPEFPARIDHAISIRS
jgi:hypothetical protein